MGFTAKALRARSKRMKRRNEFSLRSLRLCGEKMEAINGNIDKGAKGAKQEDEKKK